MLPLGAQQSTGTPGCGIFDGGNPRPGSCPHSEPASLEDDDSVSHAAGNPIDVLTGNKYQRDTDLPALPGVLGIEIVRHYNSTQAGRDAPLGPFGRGWRLSYDTELHLSAQTAIITQADGRQLHFARSADDNDFFLPLDSANGLLWQEPGQPLRWQWQWHDGRQLSFNVAGKLLRIQLPSGEFVSLNRGPAGELLQVTDPQGRSLRFEYPARNHRGFRGVRAIHTPFGRFEYHYQDQLSHAGVGNLLRVRQADGGSRHYHYGADEPTRAPKHPHHLTGISLAPPPGTAQAPNTAESEAPAPLRIASYAYDEQGRAILSVRGPFALPPARGLEQVELHYPAAGHSVLTNSLGQQTDYHHQRIGGQPRLLAVLGPGCSSCGAGNMRYRHDSQGQLITLTRLDAQGKPEHSLLFSRDAAGRIRSQWQLQHSPPPSSRLQPQPLPQPLPQPRLLKLITYLGEQHQPAQLIRPSVVRGQYHVLQHQYNEHQQLRAIHEYGFSPLAANGQPARSAAAATALSRSLQLHYQQHNGRSLLAGIEGDGGFTRQFDWDEQGNFIRSIRFADGSRLRFEHDPHSGLLQTIERHDGLITRFRYDQAHQPNQRQLPRHIEQTAADGSLIKTLEFRYDAFGQLQEAHDLQQAQASTLLHWSPWGQLLARLSPLGISETFRYDSENRLRQQHRYRAAFSLEQHFDYDSRNRLVRFSDSQGRSFQLDYDPAGELIGRRDGDGLLHRNGADTSAAHARPLHDDFGRLVYYRDADRGTQTRHYDTADRLLRVIDAAGNEVRLRYAADSAAGSRPLHRQIIDAHTGEREDTYWDYDPITQRLRSIRHPAQHERYQYDGAGRLQSRELIVDPAGRAIALSFRHYYDERGQLIANSLADGRLLHYQRNAQGQITALELGSKLPAIRQRQTIVDALQRDVFGLRSLHSGNGIDSLFLRNQGGVLTAIRHQLHRPPTAPSVLIADARAHPPARSPADSAFVLLDRQLHWDMRGNLLRSVDHPQSAQAPARITDHAYNTRSELLSTARWLQDGRERRELAHWYQAYNTDQRLLGQQHDGQTRSQPYPASAQADFDSRGNLLQHHDLQLHWNAAGQLAAVSRDGQRIAEYRYDHRGLRISRERFDAQGRSTGLQFTIYDDSGQPLAELDGSGQLLRQYLWLADLPVALIDSPHGLPPAPLQRSFGASVQHRLSTALKAEGKLFWLQLNHLGAPELATDTSGRVHWRADYAPFGAAHISADNFQLDLRLPGQHFDEETGLHYNRARYYDPASGHYLSPDPLGSPDGPNPYAYAAFNPLRYIDPQGLILFAFDGTGQDESNPLTLSNVVHFRNAYRSDDSVGFYITGPGTLDERSGIKHPTLLGGNPADVLQSFTGKARVDFLLSDLHKHADLVDDDEIIDLDIIGYSRGAAEARDFANQIAANTVDGWYAYSSRTLGEQCQKVNFRFLGLWDTVLSTHVGSYQLAIPDAFQHVAQAVAVNEYRGLAVAFPLESILGGPVPAHQARIERGFLGAHSDIGGGFVDGELARIALNWMVEQAKQAGLMMEDLNHSFADLATTVVFHDSSSNLLQNGPRSGSEDRQVRYLDGTVSRQREAAGQVLNWSDTSQFIHYRSDPNSVDKIAGTVDMQAYVDWLLAHDYSLDIRQP
ncbi:MAG: RHS repeat-associated core domain-containing protein [Thauera sp.]|nr:RHS repeat-associated core domain-containing protein [Thauera sp.]